MSQLDAIMIRSESAERLDEVLEAVQSQLPLESRIRFNRITIRYMELYDLDGLFARVNNRTVAQVLAEFDPKDDAPLDWMDDATQIASGERDGVRWELHDAPDGNDANELRP